MNKLNLEYLSPEVRVIQSAAYDAEWDSFLKYQTMMKSLIEEKFSDDLKVLVIDTSQGAFDPSTVGDEELVKLVQERQFGNGEIGHGEAFRHLLGFSQGDSRCLIWDAEKGPYPEHFPALDQLDGFLITGGPAMPSELDPGNETGNTKWLSQVIDIIKGLSDKKIPGLAFCLGHQLWNYAHGSKVGPAKESREFGTVTVKCHSEFSNHPLLNDLFDQNSELKISSSHSESVLTHPESPFAVKVCSNDYTEFQGFMYCYDGLENIYDSKKIVLSFQNHPEMLGICLEVLRKTRFEKIKSEGLPIEEMIFTDTPNARMVFRNFLNMI